MALPDFHKRFERDPKSIYKPKASVDPMAKRRTKFVQALDKVAKEIEAGVDKVRGWYERHENGREFLKVKIGRKRLPFHAKTDREWDAVAANDKASAVLRDMITATQAGHFDSEIAKAHGDNVTTPVATGGGRGGRRGPRKPK